MRVKVKNLIAGPWGTFPPNSETDELPDHVALALIAARAAELVEEKVATAPAEIAATVAPAAPVETATTGPSETEEFPPSRRRKK